MAADIQDTCCDGGGNTRLGDGGTEYHRCTEYHKTVCTHVPAWLTEVKVNSNHNDGPRGKVEEGK